MPGGEAHALLWLTGVEAFGSLQQIDLPVSWCYGTSVPSERAALARLFPPYVERPPSASQWTNPERNVTFRRVADFIGKPKLLDDNDLD